MIVVSDEPDLLVVYLPEGAPFAFPERDLPSGPHPWSIFSSWHGHGVLMLHRPGDAYAVWLFWQGQHRAFSHWYLNLQDPFRRTRFGFDTLDHVLDLWSPDGRSWHWKDLDQLEETVAGGHFTAVEAAVIRDEAARLEAELGEHGPWWDLAWAEWAPPAGWPAPSFPPGWELRSSS